MTVGLPTSLPSVESTAVPEYRTGLDGAAVGPPGAGARTAIGLIRLYQLARTGRTSPCRFVPTCSQYAVEAVERHGLRAGLRLAVARLARCRPGGPFGSDPVPE
jgi:putative membrane protein insertion efficiency factor